MEKDKFQEYRSYSLFDEDLDISELDDPSLLDVDKSIRNLLNSKNEENTDTLTEIWNRRWK
jgi:hypothetical protein